MTTNLLAISDDFFVAPQIIENDFAALKEAGINLVINNRPDFEEPGILSVEDATKLAEENGITYLHLPMANGQPLPDDLIPKMQAALTKQTEENGKTLAHCRSGTRSSFLWGVIQILEGKQSANEVAQAAANAGINLGGFMSVFQQLESQC